MRNTHFLLFLLISTVGFLPTFAQNMLLNGNFEQLAGGNPAHWSLIAEKIETPIEKQILPQKEATTSPKGIYFDTDKYALRELSFQVLDEWAELLHQNPTWKIEILGHTDAEGNNRSNQILAQNRINSIVNYLISKEIEKKRMIMINFAAEKPAASNETEDGKQLNRRVEIKVIPK